MSLTLALSMTTRGLQSAENQLAVVSQNITSADKPGYTRKVVTERYVTTNAGTFPVYGGTLGSTDVYLTRAVVKDSFDMGYKSVLSDYLDLYQKQMGTTDGATTLSGYMNSLYSTLQILSTSPETDANKAYVISVAQNLVNGMRNLSGDIQSQRLQVDKKIQDVVTAMNASIEKIHTINSKIVTSGKEDASTAEYKDQMLYELEQLGQEIGIQYYFNSSNQVQIYTVSGQPLLTSFPHPISYSATTALNGSSLYPAAFGPIAVDGVDLTPLEISGQLGGLVKLRDGIFVEEQAKLDEFANTLKFQMNAVLNTGTSLPPQSTMTGSLSTLTPATAFSATGTVRVGVVDNNGIVVNYADVNLAPMTSVNDVLTALNAIPNISASLNATGQLQISSTVANSGIAINTMSSDVGPLNQGFSHYFGLNDLFSGDGAETIDVAEFLRKSNNYLATGSFSSSPTLAAGDRGVSRGDGSIADALSDLLVANVSFDAAGNFAAQSNTLKNYMESIMANAANRAQIADDEAETSKLIYQQTKDLLNNKSGVNIDEETARMVDLQTKYQASASVVLTIRTMFQALMDAVR